MAINIKIEKRDLWLLVAAMVFLVAAGYVIAIGSGNYKLQGHDFSELQNCSANQVLKTDSSGNWQCGSFSFGNFADVTASAATESNQGPAASDGFLVISSIGETSGIDVYTGSNPGSLQKVTHENSHGAVSLTVPVKKGDYWRTVIGAGSFDKVYWIPLN